jgi:hypothetical protein
MHIFYDGITLTMLTLDAFWQDVVMDDSKTDKLYDKFLIKGTFVVNGQENVRVLGDVPVSYKALSGSGTGGFAASDRHQEASDSRPPGMARPSKPAPDSNDGIVRQRGVVIDPFSGIAPYAQPNFSLGFGSPAFYTDQTLETVLEPEANPPVLTEKLIRTKLTQPRGQLIVFSGTGKPDEILLHSPGWNKRCDAKNGPIPLYCNIIQSHGDANTFVVEWACETYVNEQDRSSNRGFNTIKDPLLSNRFSMTHAVGEDSFMLVGVEGTAIFDVGILQDRGINPDNYRPQLFLPVPKGFVRGNIQVAAIPGMEGVRYSFVDRQMPINFAAGPYARASKIEAHHRQYINCSEGALEGAVQFVDSRLNRRWLKNAGSHTSSPDFEKAHLDKTRAEAGKASAEAEFWKARTARLRGGK